MCKQVVSTTIDILSCNDMVTCMCQCLKCIGKSGCSGTNGKRCNATFECGDTFLKYVLCRVRQTAVDVTGILQSKPVCCVFTVVEHIRRCQIDWNGSCVRNRIRLFLSYVQL